MEKRKINVDRSLTPFTTKKQEPVHTVCVCVCVNTTPPRY